jgi:hypothetical protein
MAIVTIEEKLLSKQNSRNIIRAKLVELGLAESSAKLEALATIIDNITNRGAVSVSLKEGETYTIPKGYHNGSGTVAGVAGGGEYKLEPTRTVKPTKSQQPITPASGFYGLEGVLVEAIPEIYQDVSSVNAAKENVSSGKIIVLADGTVVAGTMPNNGDVTKVLDATTVSFTIPKGEHSGNGKVSITLETKEANPTKETQYIEPTAGKVLSKVIVNPIPDKYVDNSTATSTDANVLDGVKYGAPGEIRTGSMPNNGAFSGSVDGITTTSVDVPAGYTSGGKVEFDDTKIVEMLDAI